MDQLKELENKKQYNQRELVSSRLFVGLYKLLSPLIPQSKESKERFLGIVGQFQKRYQYEIDMADTIKSDTLHDNAVDHLSEELSEQGIVLPREIIEQSIRDEMHLSVFSEDEYQEF